MRNDANSIGIRVDFFLVARFGRGGVTFLEARYGHILIAEIDANSVVKITGLQGYTGC